MSSQFTVATHGLGHAIGMGQIHFDGVAQIDPPTAGTCANGFPNVNVEVLTAANGDQLVIRSDDIACPTGPASFHGTGSWHVVTGTGRFAQARGSGTTDARGDFAAGTFDFTFVGSLSAQM